MEPTEDLELEDFPQPGEGEEPPDPEPEDDKGKGKGKDPEGSKAVEAEIARLRRENEELRRSEQYWADQARRGTANPEADEPDDDPDDDIDLEQILGKDPDGAGDDPAPDEFIDQLSKQGPKAIEAALAKKGYLTRAQAAELAQKVARQVSRQMIDREVSKQTVDSRIVRDYPELQDEKSELFKETQNLFRAVAAHDPAAGRSGWALILSAEAAKRGLAAKNGKTGRDRGGDYDYRDEREEDRRRRRDAQMGETGRGTRSGADLEDDEMLGPEAKHVLAMFGPQGVKEADYRQAVARARRGRR